MKKTGQFLLLLPLLLLAGCSVVGGIFKAGAVTGIIAVVVGLAIIIWIISLFRKKS